MADENTRLSNSLEDLLKMSDDKLLSFIDNQKDTDEFLRRENTITAVNAFLRKLLNRDSIEFLDNQIKADRAPANIRKATPTYNVRTPVIYIWINGVPVFPFDKNTSEYSGIYFQGFDVTYPLSGVQTSVQGNLNLYAKYPDIIIDAIEGNNTNKVFDVNNTANLPIVTIQWGWKFSLDGNESCKEVLSPAVNFVTLYIDMTNPDTGGVEFKFTLQDIGDTILNFSRKSFAINEGYPQQQIRYLIEGMLNFRLFTLDDLLNLIPGRLGISEEGKYDKNTKTFFVNDMLGPTKTNNHTYLTVSQRLAYLCKCRWTSITNENLEKAISDSKTAEQSISNLKMEIEQLKNIQTNKTNNKETSDKIKNDLAKKQEELNKFYTNLALSCKLYWVDNMPPEYRTTSNDYYIKDEETKKETGAFFLLPDLSHVDGDETIPLCYGPGSSSFPYLHGSANNVFNASSDGRSCTFGDVIAISCKYDNIVSILKNSVYEQALSFTDGQYLSVKNGAATVDIISDKYTKPKDTTEEESKKIAEREQSNIDQENNQIRSYYRRAGSRTNFRCLNACSPTGATIGDIHSSDTFEDSGLTTPVNLNASDKQYYNTSGVKEFTSMALRSRLNMLLKYPTSINMTVFGDPTLLRLGVGGFELLSYYPTEDGSHHKLNQFLSGVYIPIQITHKITLGDYVCEISGLKQNKIARDGVLIAKINEQNIKDNMEDTTNNNVVSQDIKSQATDIQLSSEDFTTGFLAKSLKDLYNKNKI